MPEFMQMLEAKVGYEATLANLRASARAAMADASVLAKSAELGLTPSQLFDLLLEVGQSKLSTPEG